MQTDQDPGTSRTWWTGSPISNVAWAAVVVPVMLALLVIIGFLNGEHNLGHAAAFGVGYFLPLAGLVLAIAGGLHYAVLKRFFRWRIRP
jgi:protein-S-isoprenylcysteine O-methyltransferase Ste14